MRIKLFSAQENLSVHALLLHLKSAFSESSGLTGTFHELKDWVSFKFPTMKTSFDMETILLESKRANGPLGATGVGEFTLVATHPAIANAVYDAIGVRIHDLPITPDRVLSALDKK